MQAVSHRNKTEVYAVSDRLCREHGLSIIKKPEGKRKNYSEWAAEKNGKITNRGLIRADIDRAIAASVTERDFYDLLESWGYEFKFYGKSGEPLERPSLMTATGKRTVGSVKRRRPRNRPSAHRRRHKKRI